jgi:hypothetical protein
MDSSLESKPCIETNYVQKTPYCLGIITVTKFHLFTYLIATAALFVLLGPLNLSLLLSRASSSSRELARHHHHQQGQTSCHIFGLIEGAIALFLFSPQSFL